MLRAYLDASQTSGSHAVPGPPLLVVAGLVGENDRWPRAERRWSAAPAKAGIEHFGMADFEARMDPPWSEWTDPRRRGVLNRLVTLTASSVLMGTVTVVQMNDYDGLGEDLKQRAGSPYVLAARARAGAIARWCEKQGVEDKVAYVFEGGDPRFREALAQIVEESDDFKNRMWIGSIVAGSKPEAAPLQMAGILAWEVTRHAPRRLGFDSTRPRCSMERLLDTVPLETAYFDARALRMMAVRHAPEDYKRSAEMFGMAMRADPGSTGAGCVRR